MIGITLFNIAVIITFSTFIWFNRKQSIVIDFGFINIILFTVGLFLFSIGNLFSTYTSYSSCSFYYCFKHFGISLFLFIYYTMIMLNVKLGIRPNIYSSSFSENTAKINFEYTNITEIKKENTKHLSIEEIITKTESSDGNKKFYESNHYLDMTKTFNKKIKEVNNLYLQSIILFLFNIICMIVFAITYINKQSENSLTLNEKYGKWSYKCELQNIDLIYDILEFFLFIVIYIKCNQLNIYHGIFRYTKYILHSMQLGLTIGPIVNVNIYLYIKLIIILILKS